MGLFPRRRPDTRLGGTVRRRLPRVGKGLARLREEVRPRPARDRRWMRMRLGDWVLYHQSQIVSERCRWMGVRALKNPLDAWIYQEIIADTRPEMIVELGSAYGGSTLFLANMLDLLGGDGRGLSVDHQHMTFEPEHERIATVTGDTRSPEVIDQVRTRCEGRRTMFIHNASHEGHDVFEDLRNYASLVTPGCYFVVEDGIADLLPPRYGGAQGPEPMAAVEWFLTETRDFELDLERERYLMTYNPRGFLRRRA